MLFKSILPLSEDWQTPSIIGRQKQKVKLKEIIECLDKQIVPLSHYVYGGPGSGKTFTITKILSDYVNSKQNKMGNIKFMYINVKTLGSNPTFTTVMVKITEELKNYLPIKLKNGDVVKRIPKKGIQDYYYLDILKEIIKQKGLILVLVLDEIDKITNMNQIDSLVYIMIDMYKYFERNCGLCSILISNKITLLDEFEPGTKSRIRFLIHFSPYDFSEIYQILTECAKHSLYDYQSEEIKDTIKEVSKRINETSNDVREAKLLLYNTLKHSSINKGEEETEKDLLARELSNINYEKKFILYCILMKHEELIKMDQSTHRSLIPDVDPTISKMFKHYEKLAKKYNIPEKSYKTFHRIVNTLSNMGILRVEIKSMGRARGITSLIYLGVKNIILKEVLIDQLAATLGIEQKNIENYTKEVDELINDI